MNINALLNQLTRMAIIESNEDALIEKLEVKAEGVDAIRYDKDKLQGGHVLDRNEKAAIELIRAKDEIYKRRRKRLRIRVPASALFHNHLNDEQAFIMDLIYVQGMSIKEVCAATGLSASWVYDIRRACVDNLKSKVIA